MSDTGGSALATWTRRLSFRTIGAIYVWIALILLFALWIPDLFLDQRTIYSIPNQGAITAIVALAVIAPLTVGVFDLGRDDDHWLLLRAHD